MTRLPWLRLALAGLLFLLPAVAQAACDPSMGGRYSGLVQELHAPEAEARFGDCRDYGRAAPADAPWKAGRGDAEAAVPEGYWVYRAPYWYVWRARGRGCDPTFGGRYSRLLHRFDAPADAANFGNCRDMGRSEDTQWRGMTDVPAGYRVYAAPEWITWGDRRE